MVLCFLVGFGVVCRVGYDHLCWFGRELVLRLHGLRSPLHGFGSFRHGLESDGFCCLVCGFPLVGECFSTVEAVFYRKSVFLGRLQMVLWKEFCYFSAEGAFSDAVSCSCFEKSDRVSCRT